MAVVRGTAVVPVGDTELTLPRPGVVVMRDRVRQTAGPNLLRRPLRVERRLEASVLEKECEVEAGSSRTDDADVRHQPSFAAAIFSVSVNCSNATTLSSWTRKTWTTLASKDLPVAL